MLQLQYFNTKLKNKHITNILDNYKLKYSSLKNELESKINELIQLFLKDISKYLETTEEIANNKKKLNNYEKMKTELESIRNQLKLKIYNEHKIKNELEILNQENSVLKLKLKSLKEKLNNLNTTNNTNLNTNNKNRSKSPLIKTRKDYNLTTPKINIRASFTKENKKIISDFRKTYNNSVDKTTIENNINKLDISLTSKFDYSSRVLDKLEKSNSKIRKNNGKHSIFSMIKKSAIKRPMNNPSNNKNKNIDHNITDTNIKKKKNIKKFLMNKDKLNKSNIKGNNIKDKIVPFTPITPFPLNISLKKDEVNIKEFKESNDFSENNLTERNREINTDADDIENKINLAIDDELKQLELDEEKIKKLLEKINKENNDIK